MKEGGASSVLYFESTFMFVGRFVLFVKWNILPDEWNGLSDFTAKSNPQRWGVGGQVTSFKRMKIGWSSYCFAFCDRVRTSLLLQGKQRLRHLRYRRSELAPRYLFV